MRREYPAQSHDESWLRGLVPLLDLFMLLFAALLILLTQMQQEELQRTETEVMLDSSTQASGVDSVRILIEEGETLSIDDQPVTLESLQSVLRERKASGARLLVIEDQDLHLTHGKMKRLRAACADVGLRAVYTSD